MLNGASPTDHGTETRYPWRHVAKLVRAWQTMLLLDMAAIMSCRALWTHCPMLRRSQADQPPCIIMQRGQLNMRSSPVIGAPVGADHAEGPNLPGGETPSRSAAVSAAEQERYQQQAAALLKQLQNLAPQARAALHAVQQPVSFLTSSASCAHPSEGISGLQA